MFSGKTLLITGGTGSFGNAVLRRFLDSDIAEIRIFSRDEKKQDEQRAAHSDKRLRHYVGDVRDFSSVLRATKNVDYIFHAAALKQVPSCEFFPIEAVRTNILGTENVLEAAISSGVKRVVCLSTDKAVYPINAMGMTKALLEKLVVATARSLNDGETTICSTRYGNVLGSRGSVIPRFLRQISSGSPLTITNPQMTRFVMTLEDAIDLVVFAFSSGKSGDLFVQKAPAATIQTLAQSLLQVLDRSDHPIEVIGTRHGEKLYEVLVGREEMSVSEDLGNYIRIAPDSRSLNYEAFTVQGNTDLDVGSEYTSHNCQRLDEAQVSRFLANMNLVSAFRGTGQVELVDG